MSTPVSEYRVRVVRWRDGWALHIEGVGVIHVTNLAAGDAAVREHLRAEGRRDHATARIVTIPDE